MLARAVVRDVYAQAEAIRKLSLMAMVTAIAPLLAPLLGSALLAGFGWRGTFAAVLVWGVGSLLVVWRMLPETLPPERRGQLSLAAAFAAYGRLALDPVAIGLLLAGGMSFAAMFAYITASPFYFIELQQLSPAAYGALFAANALGIFGGQLPQLSFGQNQGGRDHGGCWQCQRIRRCAAAVGGGDRGRCAAGRHCRLVRRGQHDRAARCQLRRPAHGTLSQNAGAAAALFGSSQFGFGMWASAAVSYTHDGSGRPMAWVILATTVMSLAGYLLYRRAAR